MIEHLAFTACFFYTFLIFIQTSVVSGWLTYVTTNYSMYAVILEMLVNRTICIHHSNFKCL